MNNTINIVFMPVSIERGMASSIRLRNFVNVIQSNKIMCKNIILIYKEFDNSLIKNNTVIIKKRSSLIPVFKTFQVLKHLLKFKIKEKNILYHYGYPQIKNIVYLLLAKLIGYKIIFDIVEDNFTINSFKSFFAKIRVKSSLHFFKRIGKLAHGIVVINDHLYELVTQYISSNTPLIKIPISIDSREFCKKQELNNFNIFYGGSFGEKDGLYYLLKAFDNVADAYPESKLILSGKGNLQDMKRFNTELNEIKHKNRVIYKGFLSREDYIKSLQNSAVHCMCRIDTAFASGGFPFKLGEMLASGNPVIVTKVGSIENYLTDKENALLIEPENVNEISSAIKYIFENKNIAAEIGRKGQVQSINLFSLKNYLPQINDFLYSV